jgi:Protein of unknown function (DUF2764)
MKLWSNSYHMLISSLPPLPARFEVDRLPISLEKLRDRLRMLEPEDAREIGLMIEILSWSRQFEEADDAAVVKRYDELMQKVTNQLVRETLSAGMDVRMIITTLRRRRRGLGPAAVGIGQWSDHVRRHFNVPDLRLGHVFPWIVKVDQMIAAGDLLTLHRNMIGSVWAYLKKRADEFYFSFEAVVLYVARWDVIRQWHELQPQRGRTIFETLVKEALGNHANIYP